MANILPLLAAGGAIANDEEHEAFLFVDLPDRPDEILVTVH